MSSLQFFCQHVIARVVLALGWSRRRADTMSWREWARTVVPNGVATGLDIGFSNYSLVRARRRGRRPPREGSRQRAPCAGRGWQASGTAPAPPR